VYCVESSADDLFDCVAGVILLLTYLLTYLRDETDAIKRTHADESECLTYDNIHMSPHVDCM